MPSPKHSPELILKARAELELRRRAEQAELAPKYDWLKHARPKQLMPESDWHTWLLLAGRGFGKTKCSTESARLLIDSGQAKRIAIACRTPADARDVLIEGPSGFMNIYPPWQRPNYEPSKSRITFHNGAVGYIYSSESPDKARGPEHDLILADELAAWNGQELWDNLMFGLRQGNTRIIIATTPRPTSLIKELVADEKVIKVTGSTFENAANLADKFIDFIKDKYEGSRLGRQELYAEILSDTPGALWKIADIDKCKIKDLPNNIIQYVVAIDPASTSNEKSDDTGIIVCAKDSNGFGYVVKDSTIHGTPLEWGSEAVRLYHLYNASAIIAESNQGGEMITQVIKSIDIAVNVKLVHASVGKRTRAEPISSLYEQHKVRHLYGLTKLEDEMCTWDASDPKAKSPNRMDAMVWGFTKLLVKKAEPRMSS